MVYLYIFHQNVVYQVPCFKFCPIYIFQQDGVAMGSPLGSLLANIFMKSLEEDLILTLKSCLCNWERYVDDTHAYVEPTKVEFILNKLNNFHPKSTSHLIWRKTMK